MANTSFTRKDIKDMNKKIETYCMNAHKNANNIDLQIGFTQETLDRFSIGFDASWNNPESSESCNNADPQPRIIIPTSPASYLAISLDGNKYTHVGKIHIFNKSTLWAANQPIFVVDSEVDVMCIEDVGGAAVGLGSPINIQSLITSIHVKCPNQPLILCIKEIAQDSLQGLMDALDNMDICYTVADDTLLNGNDDVYSFLLADRNCFMERVQKLTAEAISDAEIKREANQKLLLGEAAASAIDDMRKDIRDSQNNTCISTGFKSLDIVLDGGLYTGLYVIGAVSSLGKTTFCLQVADQIAEQEKDVLIFSLEMARHELMAKSVSRQTYIICKNDNLGYRNAKTTRGILNGKAYANYSKTENKIIDRAFAVYKNNIGGHIYIHEGIGNIGINEIRTSVAYHTKIMGSAPVVLIDYLQIMAPENERATDKQNTDNAVTELKRLSRDFKIPVVGISSFNRENYVSPVNMTSFKESGAIEYSADVLLGLQYYGMDYQDKEFDKDKKRSDRIRKLIADYEIETKKGGAAQLQLKILKNRNGNRGSVRLDFFPMFNYFEDKGVDTLPYDPKAEENKNDKELSAFFADDNDATSDDRIQLDNAYNLTKQQNSGAVTIEDLSKRLGISERTVKSRIKKYRNYQINGNIVTENAECQNETIAGWPTPDSNYKLSDRFAAN